jgi:hypothetical protein
MERTSRPRRRPYVKPMIRRIRLVPGEVAVAGCKTRTGTTGPTLGCFRTNCRTVGS